MRTKFFILATCILMSFAAFSETFEGKGRGFGGDIVVDVEITEGKLVTVNLKSESESDFAKPAIETTITKVIEAQNINIDDVAGATATSKGTKRAISNAAKKAGLNLK